MRSRCSSQQTSLAGFAIAVGALLTAPSLATAQCVTAWETQPVTPDSAVHAFATAPDGTVYAGGSFTSIDGVAVSRIARQQGSAWQPLGIGVNNTVDAIGIAWNGDVYVGGSFSMAGGIATSGFARWDGTAWATVPGGLSSIRQIVRRQNGNLLVAGSTLAEVSPTGTVVIPGAAALEGVVELPDGRVGATGSVQSWGTGLNSSTAIWNGTSWQPTGNNHINPFAIGLAPNGDLVVSAAFLNGERIMRWDGSTWQPLGNGLDNVARDLSNLPTGELVAGGFFQSSGATSTPYLASFDGAAWQPLGFVSSAPTAVHFSTTGTLFAATDAPNLNIARRSTSCPSVVQDVPSNCPAVLPILEAVERPFVGGTYRALGRDIPNGLVVEVYGFQSLSTPLNAVLASGSIGCKLLVDPVFLQVAVPIAGVATTSLPIPAAPSLANVELWHQLTPFELGSLGSIVEVTTSNALGLTIGSF